MIEQDSMNVIHERAAGLDIHKMQIAATIRLARPGLEAAVETRTFSALPSGLAGMVGWLGDRRVSAAVMEATGIYWEAPFDALESAGIEPILVHALHVKQLRGRKTDIADSVWLSRICQFGLCSPSLVPPAHFRQLRKVSRQRRELVRERARVRNRVHKIVDAAGIRVGGVLSDLFGVNGLRILEGLAAGAGRDAILASLSGHVKHHMGVLHDALDAGLDEHGRFLLADQLLSFRATTRRLAEYDNVIAEGLKDWSHLVDILVTVPGIDCAAARAILVELGPKADAFPSRRHCAAWAGLCPGNNESAGKRRSGRTRRGNTTLREVMIECAHAASRTRGCQYEGYHKSLAVRRGRKRATVATAHKMLKAVYSLLRNGRVYRDPEANYEELMVKRNAPRWIEMLKKYNLDSAA